jgi:hypothetical protein
VTLLRSSISNCFLRRPSYLPKLRTRADSIGTLNRRTEGTSQWNPHLCGRTFPEKTESWTAVADVATSRHTGPSRRPYCGVRDLSVWGRMRYATKLGLDVKRSIFCNITCETVIDPMTSGSQSRRGPRSGDKGSGPSSPMALS